jgi:hypothetical protein
MTYTYGPQQTLVNQHQTYADGVVATDYTTGVITNVAISVVSDSGSVMTNADGIRLQESVQANTPDAAQNTQMIDPAANGIFPDTLGPAQNTPQPLPGAATALNQFMNQPMNIEATQELYVTAPNRGVVLYAVNKITMTNVDAKNNRVPFTITHTPVSVTPTVIR